MSDPKNDKEKRIINRFLFFPKSLNVIWGGVSIGRKTKWLKRVKIIQRARPHFSVKGTSINLDYFFWEDESFIG